MVGQMMVEQMMVEQMMVEQMMVGQMIDYTWRPRLPVCTCRGTGPACVQGPRR